jgi:uncharacterized protein YqeY
MKATFKEALKSAMKAQDKLRLETIRSVLTEIQYEEMQKSVEQLGATECLQVVQREVKKRQEAIQFEEQAGRAEQKAKLQAEIAILEEFLPKQLSGEELEKIIVTLKEATPGLALNVVMKHLKDNYAGQYDGKSASEIAKRVVG